MEYSINILSAELALKDITITFYSNDNVNINDLFFTKFQKKKRYFKCVSVKAIGELLEIQAVETGYWTDKLSKQKDFDLRSITGLELHPVKDEKEIEEIKNDACLL